MLLLRSKLYLGGRPMFKPVCLTFASAESARAFIEICDSSQRAVLSPNHPEDVVCKTSEAYLAGLRHGGTVNPSYEPGKNSYLFK